MCGKQHRLVDGLTLHTLCGIIQIDSLARQTKQYILLYGAIEIAIGLATFVRQPPCCEPVTLMGPVPILPLQI